MTGRSYTGFSTLHMVVLAFALLLPAPARAATCTVTSTADSGAGTLRDALADPTCDSITFAGLTLPATITLTDGELVVDRSVTISGPGADQLTVMRSSEASPFRIVHITAGTVEISGLTIANGHVVDDLMVPGTRGGGGMLVESSAALTLSNSTVSGNRSTVFNGGFMFGGLGGGLASHGTLTVTNSAVSGNTICLTDTCTGTSVGNGGGISSLGGTLTLIGSTVSDNRSERNGGGISSSVGATITNSTISGNGARLDGGGIFVWGGNVTIAGSTISGNSTLGGTGGGIHFDGLPSDIDYGNEYAHTLSLVNSSVVGNTSCSGCSGGIANWYGILSVTNTTFSGNQSPVVEMFTQMVLERLGGPGRTVISHSTFADNTGARGTLVGYIDFPEPGRFEVRNSILADTAGPGCVVNGAFTLPITDGGFNLEHGSTCGFTAAGSQSGVDPMLGPLQNNGGPTSTRALSELSPAIDMGTCTDVSTNPVTTDQRGVARPQGPGCDIGAYELQQAAGPVFSGFLAPVANPPTANFVKAGQAIPVKFSLGGDFGLNIFAPGSPGSQQVGCTLSPSTSEITATVTAGNSGLTYDPVTQTYTYVWKTEKSWANTCRRLTIAFSVGGLGTRTAEFTFRK